MIENIPPSCTRSMAGSYNNSTTTQIIEGCLLDIGITATIEIVDSTLQPTIGDIRTVIIVICRRGHPSILIRAEFTVKESRTVILRTHCKCLRAGLAINTPVVHIRNILRVEIRCIYFHDCTFKLINFGCRIMNGIFPELIIVTLCRLTTYIQFMMNNCLLFILPD